MKNELDSDQVGNEEKDVIQGNDLLSNGVYYGVLTVDGIKQAGIFSVIR